MVKRVVLHKGQKITAAQKREIRNAARGPILFDEDSPRLTPKAKKAFQEAVVKRNKLMARKKTCV